MRTLTLLAAILGFTTFAQSSEVLVYNQRWTAKITDTHRENWAGRGYIVIDRTTGRLTRLSAFRLPSTGQKYCGIEHFTSVRTTEAGSSEHGGILNAYHAAASESISTASYLKSVYLRGRQKLLEIGPDQEKLAPKLITGTRRMNRQDIVTSRIEEHAISAVFNANATQDSNANNRTIDEEITILSNSLKDGGYQIANF